MGGAPVVPKLEDYDASKKVYSMEVCTNLSESGAKSVQATESER